MKEHYRIIKIIENKQTKNISLMYLCTVKEKVSSHEANYYRNFVPEIKKAVF